MTRKNEQPRTPLEITEEQYRILQIVNARRKRIDAMKKHLEAEQNRFYDVEAKLQNECAQIGHVWDKRKANDGVDYIEHFCVACGIEANTHNDYIKEAKDGDGMYTKETARNAKPFVFPK